MRIANELIVGYDTKEGTFCLDCYDGDENELKIENFLIEESTEDLEDYTYFCDKCRKRLN